MRNPGNPINPEPQKLEKLSTESLRIETHHPSRAATCPAQVRRLHEFGLTQGELTRYLAALLKDSEQLAAMLHSIPSLDNLEFTMESDALGHTVMDQEQGHQALLAVAPSVNLEDVRTRGGERGGERTWD